MFNLEIDSKLWACGLTRLQVQDVRMGGHVPEGQFKLLHLWAAKFPQTGPVDYASDSSVTASLVAASRRR